MITKPFRSALAAITLGLLVLPVLIHVTESHAAGYMDIQAPAEVGIGQPFLVQIASRYCLNDLTVTWQGREVKPMVTEQPSDNRAVVMLGTRLDSKPGKGELTVSTRLCGNLRRFTRELAVIPVDYDTEALSVPPRMVKPPKATLDRIARERKLISAALETVSPQRRWTLPFSRPAKGIMLSRFGLHRTFNGDTQRRHRGLDFRAWKGTPLHAIANGRVILTGHFYFAGKAAFIDHGNGLISLYCHMSKLLVDEGDDVAAGDTLGLSGATGRVTGAHLHLAVFAQGAVVDPEPLIDNRIAAGVR